VASGVHKLISYRPSTIGEHRFILKPFKLGLLFNTDSAERKKLNNNNAVLSESAPFKGNNDKRLKMSVF
jgi:hypothetical protein